MVPRASTTVKDALSTEEIWIDHIGFLKSHVRHLVYSANITFWRGQEEEIIQETACRVIQRAQQARLGKLPPIHSPKGLMKVIAHHYCIDRQRQDSRLKRMFSDSNLDETSPAENSQMSLCDLATEQLYLEELFTHLAYEIARFPAKRRKALLIDLANRMRFDEEATPLQKALLAEGIDLRTYQQPLPSTSAARKRHSALVSLAYKHIGMLKSEVIQSRAQP
jgi:DNA-directed RNA polymerase specialized sigma24 family protein